MSRGEPSIMRGARLFVSVIYVILGLSFLATTAVLAYEFQDTEWFTFATSDSHLFLFFPTLGMVALAAFYVPSCALVDLYWRHVAYGPARFISGFVVLAALAVTISIGMRSGPAKSVWEIAPRTLQQERKDLANCGTNGRSCDRLALLDAVSSVRRVSQSRFGLKDFVRDCTPDPLFETTLTPERKRFCFAATPLSANPRLLTDSECCRAQDRLERSIETLYAPANQRSLTGLVHAAVLPLKVFFLLVLLAISILLALRHTGVEHHYASIIERIELGVLVGAISMLFFPLMSQAFVQTADVLYGTSQSGGFKPIVPLLSFAFGAWALLILLFFYHRRDRQVEMVAKMAGVVASALAVVKYDLIVAVFIKLAGSGSDMTILGVMSMLSLIAVLVLLWPTKGKAARKRAKQQPQRVDAGP